MVAVTSQGRWARRTLSWVLAASVMGSCSSAEPNEGPELVATVGVWADIANELLCDGDASVAVLIPFGVDLHDYELSLEQRAQLGRANMVLANGLGLETNLDDVLSDVADQGGTVLKVGSLLAPDRLLRSSDGVIDPHIWLDPQRVTESLPGIAEALVDNGFTTAPAVGRCRERVEERLSELDSTVAMSMEALPVERRSFISGHGVLDYFADRYQLEPLGSLSGSSETHTETDAAHLAELLDVVEQRGITTIFMSIGEPDDAVTALQEDTNLGVVEVATSPRQGQSYFRMLDELARAVRTALDQ